VETVNSVLPLVEDLSSSCNAGVVASGCSMLDLRIEVEHKS
jgi:hypothetical protein